MILVNCLLNLFAICLFEEVGVLLKVIERFVAGFVDLPERLLIVVHSLLVFDLCDPVDSRCSFHISVRWFWMALLISRFRVGRLGSLGFDFRVWFLLLMRVRMWSGNGLCFWFILPLGMWCLSARSMAFVRIWFDLWGWFGGAES